MNDTMQIGQWEEVHLENSTKNRWQGSLSRRGGSGGDDGWGRLRRPWWSFSRASE